MIIAQPIPQSPSLPAHRSVTHVQHILIWLISNEELTHFSFLNTLLRLPDSLRDIQLKLLTNYASGQGFTVVEKYVDVETAGPTGRSGFAEMVNYFKKQNKPTTQKESHPVLLVEKTDRLYRNLKDWVILDELNLEIHFVKENFVLSPESRSSEMFIHGIKVLMAKNYILLLKYCYSPT